MKRIILSIAALILLTAIPLRAAEKAKTTVDFKSFHIIADRNIFNASRSGTIPRTRGKSERVAKVDSFTLLGTMSYEKGRFAIFDGSNVQFRKILKPADIIAGYKITAIAPNQITLATTNGQPLAMRVGMQMRRQDGSSWALSSRAEAPTTSSPSAVQTNSEGASAAPENDVLKRLMQKREQLNK
jgi:hypothetical protein